MSQYDWFANDKMAVRDKLGLSSISNCSGSTSLIIARTRTGRSLEPVLRWRKYNAGVSQDDSRRDFSLRRCHYSCLSNWKERHRRQWAKEFRALRGEWKNPYDFGGKKYGYQTCVELMMAIDEELPDVDRIKALKAAFYAVNTVTEETIPIRQKNHLGTVIR